MPPKRKTPAPAAAPPVELRDRIEEFVRVPGRDIDLNPKNFRRHPDAQRKAMAGILTEIGVADALIVWRYSVTGRLTLIDGELRRELGPDHQWPVLVTDLTDDEAFKLLAFLDHLAGMASQDDAILADLIGGMTVSDPRLGDLLGNMQGEVDLMLEMSTALEGAGKPPARDLGDRRFQVKAVINLPDLSDFESALRATGRQNRGEALMLICREYLERQSLII
jgi:hypothetical protein